MREALSDVANALQAAVLVTSELEAIAPEHGIHVARLKGTLQHAVAAIRRLQAK